MAQVGKAVLDRQTLQLKRSFRNSYLIPCFVFCCLFLLDLENAQTSLTIDFDLRIGRCVQSHTDELVEIPLWIMIIQ